MYNFSEEISYSDINLKATKNSFIVPNSYHFKRLTYPDVHIPNRGWAWTLNFLPEDSKEKQQLRENINKYDQYLDFLESIPGFLESFISHGLRISHEYVSEKWSSEIANAVFAKPRSYFSTDLNINNGFLFDSTYSIEYQTYIEGEEVTLPIGKAAWFYPQALSKKQLIWNWVDNGHDFCFGMWELLGERYWENEDAVEDENAVHYSFDAYDQFRGDAVEPQLVRIFKKLEHLGYIKAYTIFPDESDSMWSYYGKSDGSIDLAIVDKAFLKNKMLMEQLEIILWTPSDEVYDLPFFITNSEGHQEASKYPGKLGGYNKLKIYGRLDCPSALRYIAKGQYIQHRVFFKDEATAIAAGYRPCAKCMPDAYKRWKSQNVAGNQETQHG